jgi:hypothetical protein
MRRSARASALLTLALLAGACTRRTVPAPVPVVMSAGGSGLSEVATARATVAAFIAAEAAGDPAADTLLATGADFLAQGIAITNRPRLAAMLGRGDGAVVEARAQVAGSVAWLVVIYQFTKPGEQPERARGTFLLEKRTAGWRIRHVHTSWVERWN